MLFKLLCISGHWRTVFRVKSPKKLKHCKCISSLLFIIYINLPYSLSYTSHSIMLRIFLVICFVICIYNLHYSCYRFDSDITAEKI